MVIDFCVIFGCGVSGIVFGWVVWVGKLLWIGFLLCYFNMCVVWCYVELLGEMVVFVEVDGELCGVIVVVDVVKDLV